MKKEKQAWSVGKQLFIGKTISGALWIGAGISGLFDTQAAQMINILFLAAVAILLVFFMRAKTEAHDEMSDMNFMLAKAKTRDVMQYLFCIFACVLVVVFGLLESAVWNLPYLLRGIFFLLMGLQDLLTGVIFRKLEAA